MTEYIAMLDVGRVLLNNIMT